MPYTALPDMRIPYDNDGTVFAFGSTEMGITAYPTAAVAIELQDEDFVLPYGTGAGAGLNPGGSNATARSWWFFFPEQREVTGTYCYFRGGDGVSTTNIALGAVYGSNDTTNGVDGTWETASLPAGVPAYTPQFDDWRSGIKTISFTGGKRTVRAALVATSNRPIVQPYIVHLYGEKVAGQTPDDVIYIDHDTTPGVEYQAPEDFGDQPLGTTVVRQFRVKNTSATKTANAINVQCNDADFAISTDGTTWVVTINITSLGPGAQSATMYVRCTTPAPGNLLGPRFARIVTTVSSYT